VPRTTELVSRMLSAVERQAFGELADLAGANAAEKRAIAGSRTFSGKRVRACGTACDGSGHTFYTGHRYDSSQWSARVRDSSRSTC